jgi:ABC-type sugar transport system ATPase subunit
METSDGLVLEQVTKSYAGNVPAVRGVSLTVAPGEVVVLAGPSGAGKTTVLRLIAGLEKLTEGRVLIGGRDVTSLAPHRRGVALAFQEHNLYPHLSVKENVRFGLAAGREFEPRWRRVAEILEIDRLADRLPGTLSGGERQRVALCRALVRQRNVTLLDEPLSNVDPQRRLDIRRQIKELAHKTGTSMVYVTHDQAEAMALADRLAILSDGRLQQVGPTDVLHARPTNRFVAQFTTLSPVAFVEGIVRQSGQETRLDVGAFQVPLGKVRFPADLASQVLLGMRPSALVERDGLAGSTASFSACVTALELQGDFTLAYLRAGASETAGGIPLVARFERHRTPWLGEEIRVSLDISRLLWFRADTGERLDVTVEEGNRFEG